MSRTTWPYHLIEQLKRKLSNKLPSSEALEHQFPGDHSRLDPPDPISNSVVKRTSAYDSVVFHHVKVGHRQDLSSKAAEYAAFFLNLFFIMIK